MSLKELRRRIASVKSTQKITSAMKMVASAKLRRLQERVIFGNSFLNSLNNKQNEFKAFVYSPFVESELSRLLKKQNNFQDAVNYLVLALEHAKNIKPEDEVKLYYDILTLYDSLGQKEQKEIYLQKCKNINIEDNFYKNMCNGMNP